MRDRRRARYGVVVSRRTEASDIGGPGGLNSQSPDDGESERREGDNHSEREPECM
jgi:hypothetical protein